ncbi:SDR family oxidoreductase [Bacillus sp. CFBP 13597]|nr:SDR family oxidoreductase [Bacillus sp. CFBP 13597]
MKILIFGGQGMAGHMIKDYLSGEANHEVWYTVRYKMDSDMREIQLNVGDESGVDTLIKRIRPDIVINAVGILNDEARIRNTEAIYVNSLFPHKLANYSYQYGFRLIHISTDCVFSGEKGNYTENDPQDGLSIYAKTKSLGEVSGGKNLTIRTSIIGPELKQEGIGLFHWFMNQKGTVKGYEKVFWNGITTLELARMIEWSIRQDIYGLVHLGAKNKISKYELLILFKKFFNKKDVEIEKCNIFNYDMSLLNTRVDFNYSVPNHSKMLQELKDWIDMKRDRYHLYSYFN